MHHDVTLIATLAAVLGLALVLGFVATRLRVPPIVGYLIAGILVGPATPGMVADVALTSQLADVGVLLMMFGVGLHFSIEDLLSVRRIAVPGAIAQVLAGTILGAAAARSWGWSLSAGVVLGVSLSVASTVVVLRSLESQGLLHTINGSIAVGWLVVQDLVVVLVLVVLPTLPALLGAGPPVSASDESLWQPLLITFAKLGAFVGFMVIVGRRLLPRLLWGVARTGSRELFTLAVISAAVGVAYASARLFSVSLAIGAFFAGMMLRESALSHRAAEESLPLRDAFAVLFFVSVGMLFDPRVLVREPAKLLSVLAIVLLAMPLVAMALVRSFRYPVNTALTVGASLAQIGEFSFILVALGVRLGLLPDEGRDLVLAAALISIAVNPLVFAALEPAQRWIRARSSVARALERSPDPLAELPTTFKPESLKGHVLMVGHGRVGSRIADALRARGIAVVVAEQNRDIVEALRERNQPAVSGDATDPAVLIQAHVARASLLVIATPNAVQVPRIVEIARTLNPRIRTLLRTHSDEEAELMRQANLGKVFMGEHELAIAMTRNALEQLQEVAASA